MLRKRKSLKKQTVSEKVTAIIAKEKLATTVDDSSEEYSDDSVDSTRVADFDEDEYEAPDVKATEFRKRNIKLLSEQNERYSGEIISRKDMQNNDIQNKVCDLSQTSELQQSVERKDIEEQLEDSDIDSEDYDNSDDDSDFSVKSDNESAEEVIAKDTKNNLITETNRQTEIQRGQSVQNQLRIWEKLLELRIHTQKLVTKSNLLPAPSIFQQQQNSHEICKNASKECVDSTTKLLLLLLELQNSLQKQNSEVKQAVKQSLKRSAETNDGSPVIKRVADQINVNFEEFLPYRNSVLLKWDDRTKFLTSGADAKNKSLNDDYNIVKKIESALSNRTALIEKSQELKNVQNNNNSDGDAAVTLENFSEQKALKANIYDDSDFYHQQLRELIEYKANTTANMNEVTKQYIELQKLRNKMKKKVDNRASKGRKLRYVVHKKLVNFMAPNDEHSTWTDESKDELYKSLFAL